MKYLLKTLFSLSLTFYLFNASAASTHDIKVARMLNDIDRIKHTFEAGYAPARWKKMHGNWDLNKAVEFTKERILNSTQISSKEFQQILRDFLSTTRDYHVQIFFTSSESAYLPFTVKGVNNKYFISWVDEEALSPNTYSISVGDELVEFDGKPVAEVVSQLKRNLGTESNRQTDQSLAEINLTSRRGLKGDYVPKGPVQITVKSTQTGISHYYQLMWDYESEVIKNPLDFSYFQDLALPLSDVSQKVKWITETEMLNPLYELYEENNLARPGLGTERTFVPPLGPVLWEYEDPTFKAYIYQHELGYKVGYVRIPSYSKGTKEKVEKFGQLMNILQENTEALVIDQVNNPGGMVLYQYLLLSTLTDKPFHTPKHRINITQEDVLQAHIEFNLLDKIKSDKEASNLFPEEAFFNTYEYCLFLKEFKRFIIEEWNAGRSFTKPTYLDGVDFINPHSKYCYKKPILILINELDFSGGDFVPAILQDNKRAQLFGTRTAGAGGCVTRFNFANLNGIARVCYTWSIAERVNGNKIEDLGVSPDYEYQISEEDLKYGFKGYQSAVNTALQGLLSTKPLPKKDSF